MSEASKETIQVPIPSPPEGWVFDGFRVPNVGDLVFVCGGWSIVHEPVSVLHITAKQTPPPWTPSISFKPGWIARDGNGNGFWYSHRPIWNGPEDRWDPDPGLSGEYLKCVKVDWPDVPASQSLTKVG